MIPCDAEESRAVASVAKSNKFSILKLRVRESNTLPCEPSCEQRHLTEIRRERSRSRVWHPILMARSANGG
jgi:hypothetical protein